MFDPKCLDLAAHFLPSDSKAKILDGLAQAIQDGIDDWLRGPGRAAAFIASIDRTICRHCNASLRTYADVCVAKGYETCEGNLWLAERTKQERGSRAMLVSEQDA